MGVNGLCHNSVPIRSFQNSFQWEFRITPIISAVFSVAYGSFILLPLQWEFPGLPLGVYCFLQLGVFKGRIGSSVDLHSRFFFVCVFVRFIYMRCSGIYYCIWEFLIRAQAAFSFFVGDHVISTLFPLQTLNGET